MRRIGRSVGVYAISIGALACATPTTEPASAPAPTTAEAPAPAASSLPAAAPATNEPVAIPPDRLRPLRESSLLADLQKAGLKPGALPRLEELSVSQRLPVMEAFTKALGVKCAFCHVSDKDYVAETENKRLTRHMWNDFTQPLRQSGKQVFCDSCHQGSAEVLYRPDHASVSAFMKQEFAGKLSTSAGSVTCETCHGAPFEPHVFDKRWGVKG